jgi:hypothetical protein
MHRHLSLRSRLVLGVLVLATIGLVAANLATYTSLRSFLISRTDTSLQAAHHEAEAELLGPGPPGSTDEHAERDSEPSVGRLQNLTRSLPGLYIETRNGVGKTLFSGQVAEFAQRPHPRRRVCRNRSPSRRRQAISPTVSGTSPSTPSKASRAIACALL